jgi:opacity protein-like surface antigen
MKQLIAIILTMCVYSSIGFAQFEKNNVELSFSGSMGSWTVKVAPSYGSSSQSQSYTYIYLTTVVDYYLIDGLSLEPEIGFYAIQQNSPSQSILMNLSYTSRIPNSMIALFLRGGYGIGNAITVAPYGNSPWYTSDKWNVNLINAGAGVKILLNENVALRIEANYRRDSFTQSATTYSSSADFSYSDVALLFGFSILLH